MKGLLVITGAVAILVATGIAHGLRTDRWGVGAEVAEAARRLDDIPLRVGEWSGQPIELDQRQLRTAQVVGHLARRYTHEPTGRTVLVLIVSGRPGAIGAHSPDVCFQGAGFQMAGQPKVRPVKLSARAVAFAHTLASKGEPRPEHLSLWWAWSADGVTWEAPSSPRAHFLRSANLFKIYFIRAVGDPQVTDDAPTVTLMEELLPKLGQALSVR
jgi:hypothetical protein